MSYELIWESEGVVIRLYGVVVWEDAVNYRQELFSDIRFKNVRYRIYDNRDLEGIKATGHDAKRGANLDIEFAKSNPGPCKIASVSDKEDIQLLAGLYGMALEIPGWKFASFVDMDLARNWVSRVD